MNKIKGEELIWGVCKFFSPPPPKSQLWRQHGQRVSFCSLFGCKTCFKCDCTQAWRFLALEIVESHFRHSHRSFLSSESCWNQCHEGDEGGTGNPLWQSVLFPGIHYSRWMGERGRIRRLHPVPLALQRWDGFSNREFSNNVAIFHGKCVVFPENRVALSDNSRFKNSPQVPWTKGF